MCVCIASASLPTCSPPVLCARQPRPSAVRFRGITTCSTRPLLAVEALTRASTHVPRTIPTARLVAFRSLACYRRSAAKNGRNKLCRSQGLSTQRPRTTKLPSSLKLVRAFPALADLELRLVLDWLASHSPTRPQPFLRLQHADTLAHHA